MAVGTATAIGLGVSALGSYLNARGQNKAAKAQQQYGRQQQQYLQGIVPQGPSALEGQGLTFLQQLQGKTPAQVQLPGVFNPQMVTPGAYDPTMVTADFNPQMADVGSWLSGSGFNVGQDALMQMLRSDPRTKSDQTLEGIMDNQGNAFDTTGLFGALQANDARAMEEAVAATRAGAGTLGQRFGTAMNRQEGNLRSQLVDQAALRNAQIGLSSHEAAQARLLQSVAQMTGREQFNQSMDFNSAQQLQNAALQAGALQLQGVGQNNASMLDRSQLGLAVAGQNNAAQQFGLQQQLQAMLANQGAAQAAAGLNQQGMLAGQELQLNADQNQQQQVAQMLQMLLGAQGQRQGLQGQLAMAGSQAGAPVAGPGYGDALGGIGQAIALAAMMGNRAPAAKPKVSGGTRAAPLDLTSILQFQRRGV